jgi:hypothetical protein
VKASRKVIRSPDIKSGLVYGLPKRVLGEEQGKRENSNVLELVRR